MSALHTIGEADRHIMNAAAETAAFASRTPVTDIDALVRAGKELAQARAALGAVRLALRSHALAEALHYHESMARTTREAAVLARHVPGRGLHHQANDHERRAAALRVLIGTFPTEVIDQGKASA